MAHAFRKWLTSGGDLESARHRTILWILAVAAATALLWLLFHPFRERTDLLVVSYDVTREYFEDINQAYLAQAAERHDTRILLSHAGSVQQAHNVARGLKADILELASVADIDLVAKRGVGIRPDWRDAFPFGSSPYYSTIVFVVRKGNPKQIRDWVDLLREDVRIASPDPQVSGAGRFAYLAATAFVNRRYLPTGSDPASLAAPAWEALVSLYARTEFFGFGARRSLELFRRSPRGDVFLAWESEALRLARTDDPELDMVAPSVSILAEPLVALVDSHVDARGTRALATAYVEFLFSPAGQAIAARNGLRPRAPEGDTGPFPRIELLTLETAFGDAEVVWRQHFDSGGIYNALLRARGARRGGVH